MFLLSRQWGWQPSEFWNATMSEWFLEFEMQRPKREGDYAGKLTDADVKRLKELIKDGAA